MVRSRERGRTNRPLLLMARNLRSNLTGGDLRSLGKSDQAVEAVARNPTRFAELFGNLFDSDRRVRMRAADAVEKVTRDRPGLLHLWKRALLEQISALEEKEVRWHVAQMLPRLKLTAAEESAAVRILIGYLDDESSIVKTCAMQALADFAAADRRLRSEIVPLIEQLTVTGTPAMRARGRKLMKRLVPQQTVQDG